MKTRGQKPPPPREELNCFLMLSHPQAAALCELLEHEREMDDQIRFDRSPLGKILSCLKGGQR